MSSCPWMRALLFVKHFFTSENGFPIHYNWPERRVGHLLGSNPSSCLRGQDQGGGRGLFERVFRFVFLHWEGHESATSQGSGDSVPSALPLTILDQAHA